MIDTKTTIASNNIYYTLKKNNIQYRQFELKDENLFFCTLPNGLTFDILIKQDEIKLWRFVGTTSVSKAGTKMEYHLPDKPYTFGFEVTDEGDICFYAHQKIDLDDSKTIDSLKDIIYAFTNIITSINIEKCSM